MVQSWGQNSWRFTISETFKVPGASKSELEERAASFRRFASAELDMPDRYMWDTHRLTSWILCTKDVSGPGRLSSIINLFIVILPGNGEYTIKIEKLVVTAFKGAFRISDEMTVREDESTYKDKRILRIVQDAKQFSSEQMTKLIPLIREKMDAPEVEFELVPID